MLRSAVRPVDVETHGPHISRLLILGSTPVNRKRIWQACDPRGIAGPECHELTCVGDEFAVCAERRFPTTVPVPRN